jgi:TPR repeat protein
MRIHTGVPLTIALVTCATFAWAGDFTKGWKAYSATDYETAIAEWQPLADAGDAEGCFGMGLLYGNGFGVDMNDELALKYYGIAAEKGHAEAQYNLGVMHQNGWGVPIDEEEGIKWYRLAAEQGIVGAQLALGRVYALDFSDRYDPVVAHKWFSIAMKLGDIDAKSKVEFLETRMSPEQIAESNNRIAEWVATHQSLLVQE